MCQTIPLQITKEYVTPLVLDVLLHFHCSPVAHPRKEAPGVKKIMQELLIMGIITPVEIHQGGRIIPTENPKPDHEIYSTTPLGKKWMETICKVPIPLNA